jgi:hypothetical protein
VIEKDVTIYGDYLRSENEKGLTAFVSIPNNVDSTYTGIIYLDATLTFYEASDQYPAEENLPVVVPLTSAPQNSLFNSMQLTSNQSFTYSLKFPSPFLATNILADIYASPHGCEEFYYSNLPSENASQYGFCGGGVYREIQVFIDGIFAGSVLPFPVIYTGGINPFLWRPLTGIMSFDIPSHRLDLTPFLGLLADGSEHSLSVTVYGNSVDGYWYVDAALLLGRGGDEAIHVVPTGLPPSVHRTGPLVTVGPSHPAKDQITFHTSGASDYEISADILFSDGHAERHVVTGANRLENDNSLIGSSTTKTLQFVACVTESTHTQADQSQLVKSTSSFYPLYVEDYYAQDETSMDLAAVVAFSFNRRERSSFTSPAETKGSPVSGQLPFVYEVSWSNQMASNASYNRSLDHSTVYLQADKAAEVFLIATKFTPLDPVTSSKTISSAAGEIDKFFRPVAGLFGEEVSFVHYEKIAAAASIAALSSLEDKPGHFGSADAVVPCFSRKLSAQDGSVTGQSLENSCEFPLGLSFCGWETCGRYGLLPVQQVAGAVKFVPADVSTVVIRAAEANEEPASSRWFVDPDWSLEKTTRHPRRRQVDRSPR